jgi:urease accessory protein
MTISVAEGPGVASTAQAWPARSALSRLLQLASPTLPVGGFSYSQGLESAVESGWLRNPAEVGAWLRDLLDGPVGGAEAELVARMLRAWREGAQPEVLLRLDQLFLASREARQLLSETRQMGWSLLSLLAAVPAALPAPMRDRITPVLERLTTGREASYPLIWTALATAGGIDAHQALVAWLWSWLENQVMAALKTVPLGQNAGQMLLFELGGVIDDCAARASIAAAAGPADRDPALAIDDGPGTFAPGFALACARHETQYSRLFRS